MEQYSELANNSSKVFLALFSGIFEDSHIDQNHCTTSKVMNFDIWAQIPPQDAKGFQTSYK